MNIRYVVDGLTADIPNIIDQLTVVFEDIILTPVPHGTPIPLWVIRACVRCGERLRRLLRHGGFAGPWVFQPSKRAERHLRRLRKYGARRG